MTWPIFKRAVLARKGWWWWWWERLNHPARWTNSTKPWGIGRTRTQAVAPELPPLQPLVEGVRKHIAIPGKVQTDLLMGTLGPKRGSPDYMAASLGNNILGQFGMMGRIGDVVREQEGLAYHASTSLNGWITAGTWEVSAGVNPANLARAIDLILGEVRRFISEPVTPEELRDSQANYTGRLPLSLEFECRGGECPAQPGALPAWAGLLPALRRAGGERDPRPDSRGGALLPEPGHICHRQRRPKSVKYSKLR